MESIRSAKRIRLDSTQQESQKSLTQSQPDTTIREHVNGTTATSAHAAWLEAKARSKERRGKRLEGNLGQEDDFERHMISNKAHTHSSPQKKSASLSGTPKKKQLDPLRNQSSGAPTPSPRKTGSTLGFFKQFHRPKAEAEQRDGTGDATAYATPHNTARSAPVRSSEQADGGAEASGASARVAAEQARAGSQVRSTAISESKRWSYERPKKTFEEEIRELEEAARDVADSEEKAGTFIGSAEKLRRKLMATKRSLDQPLQARKTPKPMAPKLNKVKERADLGAGGLAIPTQPHTKAKKSQLAASKQAESHEAQAQSLQAEANVTTTPLPPAVLPLVLTEETFSAATLRSIQSVILQKLTGKRPIRLINLDEEYSKISSLITQTITAGESNSMLVIGARGSGKTAILNQVLREQAEKHSEDFHVVRLNGFIHTDDRMALREIWRQLGREMDMEDETGSSKNLADTLATLLALLSHPTEQGRDDYGLITKSVIFILDEFELFASHPRQMLLYNLFDIVQSRKAPIAVIGLTNRIDVAETLEKRVKSRFSHRYVYLSPPKSLAAFRDACAEALRMNVGDLTNEPGEQPAGPAKDAPSRDTSTDETVAHNWNAVVEALQVHAVYKSYLHRLYYTSKSIPEFHTAMLVPTSMIATDSATTSTALLNDITNALASSSLRPLDSKIDLLASLSALQLAVLICAARLTNIHSCDTVPFVQAYEEYKVLASKSKLQATASGSLAQGAGSRIWNKDIAKGAWEDLIQFGLMMDDGSRGGRVDVGLEEIGMSGVDLGSWTRWCREV